MLTLILKPAALDELGWAFEVMANDPQFLEDNPEDAEDTVAIDAVFGDRARNRRAQPVTLTGAQWGIVAIEIDNRATMDYAAGCRSLAKQLDTLRSEILDRSPNAKSAYDAFRELQAQLNREAAEHLAKFRETVSVCVGLVPSIT